MQVFIFILVHPGLWQYCVHAPDLDIVNGL